MATNRGSYAVPEGALAVLHHALHPFPIHLRQSLFGWQPILLMVWWLPCHWIDHIQDSAKDKIVRQNQVDWHHHVVA